MRRFLLKAVIFFIIIYLPIYLYIQLFPMNFFYQEYAMFKYQKDVMANTKGTGDADILIMGDSRTMSGVIPDILSDKARSFCVPGETPVEIYYMLKNYLKNHKAPKTIFTAFSPTHYEPLEDVSKVIWERSIKYKFLSFSEGLEFLNMSGQHPFKEKLTLGDQAGQYSKYLLYRVNFLYYYYADLRSGKLFARREQNIKKYEELRDALGFTSFGTSSGSAGLNTETKRESFERSPLLLEYMNRFLALCSQNNIHIVYESVPVNQASFSKTKEGYKTGYRDYLKGLQSRYPNFTIDDTYKAYPNKYFGDASHLNKKGAEKFSAYLRNKYSISLE